jgi:PAS domain S-box-containing protein
VISKRRAMENREELATAYRALAQSEQRFRDLAENISDWIWEVDESIRYVYASPKVTELLGYTMEEVLGKTPFDFMPAEEAARVRAGIDALVQNPHPIQALENINVHRDGSLRVLETSAILLFDAGGRFSGLRGIDRDITKRKEAEEEIRRLNRDLAERAAELEAANKELDAFNYTVAHDLRQPLNLLSSYCQVIEKVFGGQLPEECLGYVREAHKVTLRMDRLIEALLRFSRMGQVEPKREMVDLSMWAHEVATSRHMTEPERQVEFRIADGIVANGDANLLRVVLDNLFGNALKYTGKREKAIIEFGVRDVGGKPAYFVRDNGAGFDMTEAGQLFTPFKRLPGAEKYRGFGIGLATVERIILRHGGRVWAEGEPDKGACIYFTLN